MDAWILGALVSLQQLDLAPAGELGGVSPSACSGTSSGVQRQAGQMPGHEEEVTTILPSA